MRKPRSNQKHSTHRKRGKGDSKPAVQVIYGSHAALAALHNPARNILNVFASENAAHRFLKQLQPFNPKLKVVKSTELDHLAGPNAVHQGLVIEASPLPEVSLDQTLESLGNNSILVVLDQITDPHNVGAILRTCAAFNVDAVITPTRNSAEFSGVLAKAASGALEYVPIVNVTNLARALKTIKNAHISVVGFDSELSDDFSTVQNLDRIALVFGAEGKGMRRLTRENCDHLVRLNMPGKIKSLNVSNACAVALYGLTQA